MLYKKSPGVLGPKTKMTIDTFSLAIIRCIYLFYRYINVIHTISMLQKISYNALGHVYVTSKIWNGILGSTKIVPVLTYCIRFVWEEKLPNIARHLFEFLFNKTHLGTTTFYCIEMTIYYTPYNIIHSRQKLASDRYLQHFF